jgi:hypothetical protein
MIVYVHSGDIYDAGRTFGRHASVRDVTHVIVPPRESVSAIAQRVIDALELRPARGATGARSATMAPAAPPQRTPALRSIWLLIFNSHGLPGRLMMGGGIDDTNVWDLAPLRPYMTPGGPGVEIHACLVASAILDHGGRHYSIGVEFMTRMAHVLNAPVRASTQLQVGVEDGWFGPPAGSDTDGHFEGDFVRVEPNGGASLHAAPGTH